MKKNKNIEDFLCEAVRPPLPNRRTLLVSTIYPLHESINLAHKLAETGCEVRIHPRNDTLDKMSYMQMKSNIKAICKRYHIRSYIFVGEYSPHRLSYWHYHGIINDTNVDNINKAVRALTKTMGQSEALSIGNAPSYANYMHKMYTEPIVCNTIQPWKAHSVVYGV